jgi:hypothetical protein
MKNLFVAPAWLACSILYGMVFLFAVTHLLGVTWQSWMTIAFHVTLLFWGTTLAWVHRKRLMSLSAYDALFAFFLLFVLGSVVLQDTFRFGADTYSRFLPFLMVLPYFCGRMMRESDIELFSRIAISLGLTLVPLLLIDRFLSSDLGQMRWPFFGQNHSPLLVAAGLVAVILSLVAHGTRTPTSGIRAGFGPPNYLLICMFTVFLVWVAARGWLVALISAIAILAVASYRHHELRRKYLKVLLCVAATVVASLAFLPPSYSHFYAKLLSEHAQVQATLQGQCLTWTKDDPQVSCPILGEQSCAPLKEGVDSVAIRQVLYREALAMFKLSPAFGVGAARFGHYSCTGEQGFPHSSILQGLAELGVIGGGLLLLLVFLAAQTLIRNLNKPDASNSKTAAPFVFAMFAAILIADQIYGNYFMAAGMYLMLGISGGMRAGFREEQNV